jgi:hypothetical protein
MSALLALGVVTLDRMTQDAIKNLVLEFLASYLGIALGVVTIVEFLKFSAKAWAKPRGPVLSIVAAFALGPAAKVIFPELYGPNDFKAWTLHLIILMFVGILAATFHDRLLNLVKGKVSGVFPAARGGAGAGAGGAGGGGGGAVPAGPGAASGAGGA